MEGIPRLGGDASRPRDGHSSARRNCEEDAEMNFAFSPVGNSGTHFVTTSGQMPVAKLQQNDPNNGAGLQQVCVAMGDGSVQYMRALDGGATLTQTPQIITLPIALPGAKPGDPQQTVQIQVLNPALLQQQQPKYQMQIPIQGFQQSGAVLTVAYSPETNETGGIQLVGQGGLGEAGMQVLATMPHELQAMQATEQKEQPTNTMHQVFITPNQQIIISAPSEKPINNNTSAADNNLLEEVVIKEESDENENGDECSQGTDGSVLWQVKGHQKHLAEILSQLPQKSLPDSLQQYLRPNPRNKKPSIEVEVPMFEDSNTEYPVAEAILGEDGSLRIQSKKKKKYKKKSTKPARPKPGQIVIATALDGTPIFCCPECQMAYPDKEQLETHLIIHKIERRFICGICGAALKRKEHLERHKMGHNPDRPYVCGVCQKGFKRREHLNLHAVIHSGVKTEMCNQCGKGFYRKDHLRKHTRSHENKRVRDEAGLEQASADNAVTNTVTTNAVTVSNAGSTVTNSGTLMPEITIHIPTSSNSQMPVQINIPQHVVSSLRAAQCASDASDHGAESHAHAQLDELLAHHT